VSQERPEIALDARADLGEGPAWDATSGTLLWVDVLAGRVHRFDPATGSDRAFGVGQPVSVALPRAGGGLALALRDGVALLGPAEARPPDDRPVEALLLASIDRDDRSMRANDGKCDPRGRLWVGTMAFEATPGRGSLYRLDPDGTLTRHLEGLTISNGIGWSPDLRTMYHTDSARGAIDAFDFDPGEGAISGRRPFVRLPPAEGVPDGLAVAADGSLFTAIWGGREVRRYAPDGALLQRIKLPVAQPTSCCFGGRDLGDLYVTSARYGVGAADLARQPHAGSLFVVRPGVSGLPTTPFAG
jgi:sugar lactone lactonase YvrE